MSPVLFEKEESCWCEKKNGGGGKGDILIHFTIKAGLSLFGYGTTWSEQVQKADFQSEYVLN